MKSSYPRIIGTANIMAALVLGLLGLRLGLQTSGTITTSSSTTSTSPTTSSSAMGADPVVAAGRESAREIIAFQAAHGLEYLTDGGVGALDIFTPYPTRLFA